MRRLTTSEIAHAERVACASVDLPIGSLTVRQPSAKGRRVTVSDDAIQAAVEAATGDTGRAAMALGLTRRAVQSRLAKQKDRPEVLEPRGLRRKATRRAK